MSRNLTFTALIKSMFTSPRHVLDLTGCFNHVTSTLSTFLGVVILGMVPSTGLSQPASTPASQGTRPATAVYPLDGVIDSEGSVWIVDVNAHGVWRHKDGVNELVIQGEKKFRKPLNAVRCIAISPQGEITVGDPATREVYRRNANGEMIPTASGLIGIPVDLAFASDGTLYIADVERRVVWKQSSVSEKPVVFANVNPRGLFVDNQDRLWVVSQDEKQLLRLDRDGKTEVLVSERIFEFPHQVVVDSQGHAWVTDGYKQALWRIRPNEKPEMVHEGAPFENPVGLFLHEDSPVVVDPHAQQVFRMRDGKPESWIRIEMK
jgi:sugar lactone lactonase YvrE